MDNVGGYALSVIDRSLPEMQALIEANASTLESLCVFDTLMSHVPVRVLPQLVELELWSPRGIRDRLVDIFYGAPQLQTFSLVDVDFNDLYTTMLEHPSVLPQLQALKFMSLESIECEAGYDAVTAFLENKRSLRRLDVRLLASLSAPSPTLKMRASSDEPSRHVLSKLHEAHGPHWHSRAT
jgi:hypothetical protein